MTKILKYELKRMMLNKFYLGLLLISGLFAWQRLTGDIIRGVAYTAPFSPWSFGYYLASIVPLLSVALLFFLTYLHKPAEKQAAQVMRATRMDPRKHLAVRYGAMAIAYGVLLLLVLVAAAVFFKSFFKQNLNASYFLPALLTLVPCFLYVLGMGGLAGRVHIGLLYVLMLLCMVLMQFTLPSGLDFTGAAYYGGTPLLLPLGVDGEPAFIVEGGFLLSRVVLAALGLAGLAGSFLLRDPA